MGLEEQVAELSARVAELERRLQTSDDPLRRLHADAPAPEPSPIIGAGPTSLPPPPPAPGSGPLGAPVPGSGPLGAPAPGSGPLGRPAPVQHPVATPASHVGSGARAKVARPGWMNTETLLKWAGLVLVVLAAIFFVGTAISRGWIGPEMQLAGATVGGLALIGGGFHLVERNRPWAAALAAGGAIVVAVCAAAANAGLDLISEYPALTVLAAVTFALGWVSYRLSLESVATVTGLAAALLPLWIVEDVDLPPLVLAGWMAVLAVVATGYGWNRRWSVPRLLTVGASALVLLMLAVSGDELATGQKYVAVIAIAAVSAVAWAGPAYPELKRHQLSAMRRTMDHRFVLSLPVWTWGITAQVVGLSTDRAVFALGLGLAVAFGLAVLAAWRRLPETLITAHLLGVGILLPIAFSVLTEGPGLLVALAVQAAATAILARMFEDRWLEGFAALLGGIAAVWAALSTLGGVFDEQSVGQLLADLLVIVLLIALAYDRWRRSDQQLTVPLILVSWVGLVTWIAAAFVHRSQGQVIVSLLWSALAATALVVGVRRGNQLSRVLGIVTLVVVLAKLLTVDLAEVDTLWRVGLFLVVGGGLLRLGYVLPRLSRVEGSPLP